ncbi:hypothetical protein [Microscilla marina]|uniref:Uncharacterized protein n=1 Tax=Microscilla marina ATCC 23134 TaxID=313606 RepID=A1ZZ47_MICM2|nr:hypothetical protein [Microscilla marina]EAY24369.1 hypothetical protein M23134_02735 [Microscilla marina ATCC 23134]
MFKTKRDDPAQNASNLTSEIQPGMWVYETSTPLLPMCVGRMLGFGMCEVVYGKYKPFQVYKRRIATLRPLKKTEMHIVDNANCREILQTVRQSLSF